MSYGHPQQQQAWPTYGYGHAYVSRRTAPVSVHIVAIVQYAGGLLMLAAAGLLSYGSTLAIDAPVRSEVESILWPVVGVLAAVGLFAIILGRKLQRGRNWARVLLNLFNLLTVASILYADLTRLHDGRSLTGLIVPVLCLILLNTRAARSWFRARTY
jgi:hypothetical protein